MWIAMSFLGLVTWVQMQLSLLEATARGLCGSKYGCFTFCSHPLSGGGSIPGCWSRPLF